MPLAYTKLIEEPYEWRSLRPRHLNHFYSQLRLITADRHASVGAPEYQAGFLTLCCNDPKQDETKLRFVLVLK